MKNIIIITSKRNLNSKNYKYVFSYLNNKKIPFKTFDTDIEDLYKIEKNSKTLLVSLGGDGTALKAMKLAWLYKLDILPLGSGRVGYLINSRKNFSVIFENLFFKILSPLKGIITQVF